MSADVVIVEPVESIGALLAQAASIARPSLPLICVSVSTPATELEELGVIFSACLIKPFTAEQLQEAINHALHAPQTPKEAPGATIGRRVLLVDDDQRIRATVCRSFERAGDWSVTPIASGEAALDCAVAAGPFDAVLLDVTMPGLGGLATMDGLRECGLPEEVPIIFLTTNAEDRERQALIFLGGTGTIAKPIDSLALPNEIERLLVHS